MIKFKRSGERLDVQRILSMGLTGLLRHEIFCVHYSYFGYRNSMGQQSDMTEEHRKQLKLDYVVEQALVKGDKNCKTTLRKHHDLVEKRDAKTWEWV